MAPISWLVLVTETGSLSDDYLQLRKRFEATFTSRGLSFEVVEKEGCRVVIVSAEFGEIAKAAEAVKICMPAHTYEVRSNYVLFYKTLIQFIFRI